MTVYGSRRFPDSSRNRLVMWVLVSIAAHAIVVWVTGLTASNFQSRSAPLHVELRAAVSDVREPLAVAGPSPDLNSAAQSQDQAPAPSETHPPNSREPADKPDIQSLPLNIYYASSEVDTRAEPLNEVDLVY